MADRTKQRLWRRLLLACLVAGCASAPRVTATASPPSSVPLSVWTVDFTSRCERGWLQPATLCRGGLVLDYDGCRWRCVSPPIDGARQ